jgi:hypothetical protein
LIHAIWNNDLQSAKSIADYIKMQADKNDYTAD